MKAIRFAALVLMGALLAPAQVLASNTVLSGVFDGTEERMEPVPGTCGGDNPLAYQDTGLFEVSADGSYLVVDAFNYYPGDVTALIYNGAFDPENPLTNLITTDFTGAPSGIDSEGIIDLMGGVSYRLVVQKWCEKKEGAWAVTFSGPGNVTSDVVQTVPAMTQGLFTDTDPTALTECGESQYQETGPVQITTSGTHYFYDVFDSFVSDWDGVDACLQVYTEPFDPANPENNRVGTHLDFDGTIELETGQDYYFVIQPLGDSVIGEYFYVLAPPAPFRINKALAGSWFYPPTSGQGFFIDVFENSNQMFLAWFTFDLTRPDPDTPSGIGEPGHRWMTALGGYTGNVANLPVYWSDGGVFDSETPAVNPAVENGAMTVEFTSCLEGTIDYDLGTYGRAGTVPIQPLAEDLLDLCEELVNVPGMPGLL